MTTRCEHEARRACSCVESSLLAGGPVAADVARPIAQLRTMLRRGELAVPEPGHGDTVGRWAALAGWGRTELSLARLAEGHVDAVAILRELGAQPRPGALYGVWAARPGGHGADLAGGPGALRLSGTVRFCSGAEGADRALVVAAAPSGMLLVDVPLDDPGVAPIPGTWAAAGMRDSDTLDVDFSNVPVPDDALIGSPGAYLERPGFWWGGAGVAAVWLGGAAGVLDDVVSAQKGADEHRLAHVGALYADLQAVDALMVRTAELIDAEPGNSHRTAAWTARSAAERLCRTVLDRAPLAAGVAGMVGSARLSARLADLQVYVRQHHGERDLAALGAAVTTSR